MKQYRILCAALLCALCLLTTACGRQTPSSFAPDVPDSSAPGAPESGSDSSDVTASENSFLVKDVAGGDYDLAATPWGAKYPFMVDYFRNLKEEIAAAGGDKQREAELLTNWYKITVPDSCVTPPDTPVTTLLGYDGEGNPDPDGPQLTTTVRSASLSAEAALDPSLMQDLWPKEETQDYLTVALTVENTGKEETVFYLNSIAPYVIVDGELAQTASVSEMVSAEGTSAAQDGHSFFRCTLSAGQSQEYTALFYMDRRLEMKDIYLGLNYTGVYTEPVPTEDPLLYSKTGTFCALA